MLTTEQAILQHLGNPLMTGPLRVPTSSSYHRMLVHRIGAYFGMDHTTDSGESAVLLQRSPRTRLPELRFKDLIVPASSGPPNVANNRDTLASGEPTQVAGVSPKTILKRADTVPSPNSSGSSTPTPMLPQAQSNSDEKKLKTMEEREAEYEEHKKRIFSQYPAISTVAEVTSNVTTTVSSTVTTSASSSSPVRAQSPEIEDPLDYDRSLPCLRPLHRLLPYPAVLTSQCVPSEDKHQRIPVNRVVGRLAPTALPGYVLSNCSGMQCNHSCA